MPIGPSTKAQHVADSLVREIWPPEALIEEVIEEEPLLGLVSKETDWGHEVRHWPLRWGANQGVGRTFADAKRLKSQYTAEEFQHGTREMFAALSIEGKLLRTYTHTKKKALLVDPVTTAGELAIDRMRRKFSKAIRGNGVGVIGRIKSTSTLTSNTITLDDFNDLKNFEEDVAFQWTTDATGGGAVGGTGEEARIYSVGTEDSPTLTLNGVNWSDALPGITTTSYLVYTGTYNNDFIYGLDAYLPLHTGASGATPITTFLTCNRPRNPGFLGGRCMTGTNLTVYQRIWKAARKLVDAGEKPDYYDLSTRNFEQLLFEMDNKLTLMKETAADVGKYKMGVTYQGVVIQGPRGPIKVMPSHWAPDNVERCGRLDTLVMGSIGPLVHWDDSNGPGDLRTEDGTDNRELRAVSDPGFLVKRPGAWMRVAV